MEDNSGEEEDSLVPIRLDLFLDGIALKDTFVWDLNETSVTPEQFAKTLCIEMDFPERFEALIASSVQRQLSASQKWRAAQRTIRPPPHLRDSLMLIQLRLTVNGVSLTDQFEWDTSSNNPITPECFAAMLCRDLGLSREFQVCIAHSIREQVVAHKRALVEGDMQHFKERLRAPPSTSALGCLRDEEELSQWTPCVSTITSVKPGYRSGGGGASFVPARFIARLSQQQNRQQNDEEQRRQHRKEEQERELTKPP
ncbi:SWI/SNF chromatin-remodeling complex subunit [Balamuthia mandrillaris]